MSRMGRAVEWVQENGLQGHPEALKMYVKHLKQQKIKPNANKDSVNQVEENLEENE